MRKGWWIGGALAGSVGAAALLALRRAAAVRRARNKGRRALVVGAGVVGSAYALSLSRAGLEVSLVARGERLRAIREEGLWVRDALSGRRRLGAVQVLEAVPTSDGFDLALVAVRGAHQRTALQAVEALGPRTPVVAFVGDPSIAEALAQRGNGRCPVIGFPGTAGVRRCGEVRCLPLWLGTTVLGELEATDGRWLPEAARLLWQAGLHVELQTRTIPWLYTHAAMAVVLGGCVAGSGGLRRMSASPQQVRFYLAALREAYDVLEANGIPVTPRRELRLFDRAVWLQRALVHAAGWIPWAPLAVEPYLASSRQELCALHAQLLHLAERAAMEVPLLESLGPYLIAES